MKRAKEKGIYHLFLEEGVHIVTEYIDSLCSESSGWHHSAGEEMPYVLLTEAWTISGAGRGKTIVKGGGFKIPSPSGYSSEVYCPTLEDITVWKTKGYGLLAVGYEFCCLRVHFTECGRCGVFAKEAKGRLIDCQITQCLKSGIATWRSAIIEMAGRQTKVDGNGTSGSGSAYGLNAYSLTSTIDLFAPLTKESVSTNNRSGKNCGGEGTIQTVNSLCQQFHFTHRTIGENAYEELNM